MKWILAILTMATCLLLAAWAVAGEPGGKLAQVAGNHVKNTVQTQGNRQIASGNPDIPSLLSEIQAVMDSTRQTELILREELGPGQQTELTRRLGELKKSSRMRILHIQLKYARQENRPELERRILTNIEDLQRPAAPGGPRLSGRKSPLPEAQAAVTPAGGSQP